MTADQVLADAHGAVLVEGAMIAEAPEVELQRLRLDEPFVGRIVDDEMGEVGLTRDRADRGELGRGEPGDIVGVGLRIRRPVQRLGVRRFGNLRGTPKVGEGGLAFLLMGLV